MNETEKMLSEWEARMAALRQLEEEAEAKETEKLRQDYLRRRGDIR